MYFLTNNLPSFLALNLSVTVLNIPPSPSQLSSSAIGVPVIVVPSKLRPFGSPSIVLNISASLSKHVTVAAFIGTPSVHFGLPGSSRTVSITLLFTSTSGKFSSLSRTGVFTLTITVALPFFSIPFTENSSTALVMPCLDKSGFCTSVTVTEPSVGILLNFDL